MHPAIVYIIHLLGGSLLLTVLAVLGLVCLACVGVLWHTWLEMDHYGVTEQEPWKP